MATSKKDYVAIARIIREHKLDVIDDFGTYAEKNSELRAIGRIQISLAAYFETTNPLFNRSKFDAACDDGVTA